jgi:DNA-3-methyladenine glycosylase I
MPKTGEWHNHKVEKVEDDNDYFERMSRVIFMSGLNWRTLEKKWPGIRKAFVDFDIKSVAKFQELEIEELMMNADVIRNLPKIRGVVANAQKMQELASEYGSFSQYLAHLREEGGEDKLRETLSKQFAFLGKSTAVIFLFSVGEDLPKAHAEWEARHQHGA